MATQQEYTVGADAALVLIKADISADVPGWAQGMIPDTMAPQLAGAVAKAVVDAVDAYRSKQGVTS